MKFLLLVLFYIGVFVSFYFLISLIALLFNKNYVETIKSMYWFIFYSVCIGWRIARICTAELYKKFDF